MHRPRQRLVRILVCAAAAPVILAASGCSLLGSGGGADDDSGGSGGATSGAAAGASSGAGSGVSAGQATFGTLPQPCATLSKGTLGSMVPEANPAGTTGKSEDTSLRGSCSWSSLDNKGVDGSQFRWLNVSLVRSESDPARGSGDKLAGQYAAKQVAAARATEGAAHLETEQVPDTGDEATAVHYDLKKEEGTFKQQTVVARTENVVVTVDYDGAGLAGEKTPDPTDLLMSAERAAREVVAAVAAANKPDKPDEPSASTPAPSHTSDTTSNNPKR